MEKIEIHFKKIRLIFLSIVGLIVSLFCALVAFIPTPVYDRVMIELLVRCFGFLLFLFMGGISLYTIKLIFSSQPQLIIDNRGITTENFGLIEWRDITNIRSFDNSFNSSHTRVSLKNILIFTTQNDKYRERLSSFQRIMNYGSKQIHGTSIIINAKGLDYKSKDLEKLLNQALNEYREKTGSELKQRLKE